MINIGQDIYEVLRNSGFDSVEAKQAMNLLRENFKNPSRILPFVVDDHVIGYLKVTSEGIVGITFYEDPGSQEVKQMLTSGEANFCEIRYLVAGHASLEEYQQQMKEKDAID